MQKYRKMRDLVANTTFLFNVLETFDPDPSKIPAWKDAYVSLRHQDLSEIEKRNEEIKSSAKPGSHFDTYTSRVESKNKFIDWLLIKCNDKHDCDWLEEEYGEFIMTNE
uniref:Uncharacterized protein n=1 Tax=Octactis speculum TaxID=3111310 RepID=A0A7S2AMF7_9STRA